MSAFANIVKGSKLTYFPLPGRAEAIRFAFHYKGVEFDDNRIAFGEWGALKATLPAPYLPCLEFNGESLQGNRAILRFVGRDLGLYPSDIMEAAKVDFIMDVLDDWMGAVNSAGQGMEKDAKEAARKEAVTNSDSKACKLFICVENNIKGPFLLGDTISVGDFMITSLCGVITGGLYDGVPSDVFKKGSYPKIEALASEIVNSGGIKEYLASKDSKYEFFKSLLK